MNQNQTPTSIVSTTAAATQVRVAAATFHARRAPSQTTTATTPSRARIEACGARAIAEWMNVPFGTWTAETRAENAKRISP